MSSPRNAPSHDGRSLVLVAERAAQLRKARLCGRRQVNERRGRKFRVADRQQCERRDVNQSSILRRFGTDQAAANATTQTSGEDDDRRLSVERKHASLSHAEQNKRGANHVANPARRS